ncbi:hypothetical protein GCM10009111_00760 [Colwellia asteriadis]|uniref:Uncharacterized protein n=1 Tax=Colwellia asteriadis TaxID=517723 RepID=A0ABN1L2L7_9GAMM
MVKDFFWWLFKENIVINLIYREFFTLFFSKKQAQYNLEQDDVISKEYIIEHYKNKQPRWAIKGYSSGTTNTPLTVYRSIPSIFLEEYIVKSYLKYIGVPLRPNIVILRGDNIKTTAQKFWIKMPFSQRLIMSSYHISEQTALAYFKALEQYKPHIIFAYPSSITLLAKYAQKLNWKPSWNLSGVLTSSENFSATNQKIVRTIFGQVYDHYGQAERVAVLQQCKQGNYHVRNDYSYVEFLVDEHGTKIVGTNLHNKSMPLKRYDTHDYIEGLNSEGSCICGNKSDYVKRILGRDDDYIILNDGRQIGRLDTAFKGVNGLIECQLEQTRLTELIVRYVPTLNANTSNLQLTIKQNLTQKLGNDINILFEQVNEVPRTKAGKFKSVIRSKAVSNA